MGKIVTVLVTMITVYERLCRTAPLTVILMYFMVGFIIEKQEPRIMELKHLIPSVGALIRFCLAFVLAKSHDIPHDMPTPYVT